MSSICNHCGHLKPGLESGLCPNCAKFGTVKTSRQQALEWWNSLLHENKEHFCATYRKNKYNEHSDNYHSLTGREIEEIWRIKVSSEQQEEDIIITKDLDSKEFSKFIDTLNRKGRIQALMLLALDLEIKGDEDFNNIMGEYYNFKDTI